MEENQLLPGDIVGPYCIVRKIGHGGMGEVYEALEVVLQRRIAIKILSTAANSQPDLVRRFHSEGRALARLNHDNIVNIYAVGEHNGHAYMAMEYIDGWPLDEFLQIHFCGFPEIVGLFRHMLEGLAAAHDAGIIHRDLKPQNVMVDRAMCAKLVDFGIAKMNEDHSSVQTATGMLIGTLNYIAPELFDGGEATKQSDIYAIGLVLYFMLNGKSPYAGKARLEVIEKIATMPLKLGANSETILPANLRNLIETMTSKFLPKRYPSARAALQGLAKVDLSALPPELCALVPPQLNVANADEIRGQCKKHGLEYLETQVIGSLAAKMTLNARGPIESKESLVISTQAVAEAIRRYTSAKRAMMLKAAYSSPRFMLAAGSCVAALLFAFFVGTAGEKSNSREPASVVKVAPPPIPAPVPVREPVPVAPPVEAAKAEEIVPPIKTDSLQPVKPDPAPKIAAAVSKPIEPFKPPVLILPADKAVFTPGQAKAIELKWQSRGGARIYEVAVRSTDSDFVKAFLSERTSAKLSEIPNGHYVWSVQSVDGNGKRGPRSKTRNFVVKSESVAVSSAHNSAPDLTRQKPVLLPAVIEKRRPAGH